MKTKIETYIVDSFTNEPFKGNPAGVCLLISPLEEIQMLTIAKELGLSETAFIQEGKDVNNYLIRYFSPKMEIPLCGHATLASAKVLYERKAELEEIHFITIENIDLEIKKKGELIEMLFPVYDTISQEVPAELLLALGIDSVQNSVYNKETKILMLEIDNGKTLSEMTPNFEQLKKAHNTINGVVVTSVSERDDYDFESRFFWPWSGTNEDPVTGGTHTFLTKYWSTRLGKQKMKSFQCSERTGFMEVELIDNAQMIIRSEAQVMFKGELRI